MTSLPFHFTPSEPAEHFHGEIKGIHLNINVLQMARHTHKEFIWEQIRYNMNVKNITCDRRHVNDAKVVKKIVKGRLRRIYTKIIKVITIGVGMLKKQ